MRLRTLLATAFAGLALCLTALGAGVVMLVAQSRIEARAGTETVRLAEQVRNLLDTALAERLSDMQVLATVSRTAARSARDRTAWVDAMRRVYPVYAWIGFADPQGRVEASTDGILAGHDVSARPWFQHGLQAPYFGDVHEAKLLASKLPADPGGEPLRFVDVSAPLQDESGAVVGVVGAHLSWRWAAEVTRDALADLHRSSPNSAVVVLSGTGDILLASAAEGRWTSTPEIARALATTPWPASGVSTLSWPDGRDYLVGADRAPSRADRPGLGWTVLVFETTEQALMTSRRIGREIMIGGLGFAAAAALLGWWLAGRLAQPLLRLSEAAVEIGRDGRGSLPPASGFREVRDLTGTLTRLLAQVAQRDAALAEANRDLEDRVAARTADLVVERGRAEAAGRAKAEFLATMSHELRTPLTGMLALHELLRDDPGFGPEARRMLGLARDAGRSLLVIVNDVLDMSKLEAGHLAIETVPFGLRHLVEGCRAVAAGSAPATLIVEASVSAECPDRLLGDPTRLRQVLMNLLANAVKFTTAGSVRAEVTARGDRLRIEVRDTGIGIDPALLPRLFERFTQADASTARRFGGTGLGLAICRELVQLMEGEIAADSVPGRGSVFSVDLPLRIAAEDAPDPAGPSRPPASRALRLLLVEDNATNREVLSAVLRRLGHEVVTAADGDEALRLTARERFHAVLMDVQMPGKDGLAATVELRERERLAPDMARLPVVALTANASPEEADRCREAGMDAHLAKPVDWDRLAAVLARVTDRLPDRLGGSPDAPPAGPSAPAVLDETVLDTLAAFIGAEQTRALLCSFQADTEMRIGALASAPLETVTIGSGPDGSETPGSGPDPAGLDALAHMLASSAGQLGFRELSTFCAGFAERTGDASDRLPALRLIAGRALAAAGRSRYAADQHARPEVTPSAA